MAEMEAHHQTPQIDTAQRRAEAVAIELLERMGLRGHPAASQFLGDILEHDKQTRRATLDDVGKALNEMHWKDHWYANQLRKKLDRLREGQ